jgi:hypothetical protein
MRAEPRKKGALRQQRSRKNQQKTVKNEPLAFDANSGRGLCV